MSKFANVMFLILICFSISVRLTTKKYGKGRGQNCDLFHQCAGDLECRDDICVKKDQKTKKVSNAWDFFK